MNDHKRIGRQDHCLFQNGCWSVGWTALESFANPRKRIGSDRGFAQSDSSHSHSRLKKAKALQWEGHDLTNRLDWRQAFHRNG